MGDATGQDARQVMGALNVGAGDDKESLEGLLGTLLRVEASRVCDRWVRVNGCACCTQVVVGLLRLAPDSFRRRLIHSKRLHSPRLPSQSSWARGAGERSRPKTS